jgi:hypothetical protein
VIDQSKKYCRGCRTQTLHNRFRLEGLWGVQMLFILTGWCWLFWPLVLPVALLIGGVDRLRPYRCSVCGRRNWKRGESAR